MLVSYQSGRRVDAEGGSVNVNVGDKSVTCGLYEQHTHLLIIQRDSFNGPRYSMSNE